MTIEWVKTPTDAWMPKYIDWTFRIPAAIAQAFEARREEIGAWMKAEAVWRDRTGAARRSLHAEVIQEGVLVMLVMQYTIPIFYSRYLETMQQGRFSILSPALDYWAPILIEDVRKLLK